MARRRSRAVRTAAGRGATLRASGVGPMQFGRSTIGWGASASPAAYAMGAAYGRLPRSRSAGTAPGPGYRRILNPWGNNVPKASAVGANSNGITPSTSRNRTSGSGRRMGIQDPSEIRIDYPANNPAAWPILGGKRVIFDQAGKANRHNKVVNYAFVRGGYAQYVSPQFVGTDASYAKQSTVPTVAEFTGTDD